MFGGDDVMPTTSSTTNRKALVQAVALATQIPHAKVKEPGTYICNWSGQLLRIPQVALQANRRPQVAVAESEELFLTRISPDPAMPISEARKLAAKCGVACSF